MRQFVHLTMIIRYNLHRHFTALAAPIFKADKLTQIGLSSFSNLEVEAFLNMASQTTEQIAMVYKQLRQTTDAEYWSLIPSQFLQHPFIAIERDFYVTPKPDLLLDYAQDVVYSFCKEAGDNQIAKETGDALEQYVSDIIESTLPTARVIREDRLQSLSGRGEKCCDVVVELADCILLLECKTTSPSARKLREESLIKDTATGLIAKGLLQLARTEQSLRKGTYASLGIDVSKPVFPVVLVYRYYQWPDSPEFKKRVIEPRLREEDPAGEAGDVLARSTIMSIDVLELAIACVANNVCGLLTVMEKQRGRNYVRDGGMRETLLDMLQPDEQSLPMLKSEADKLIDSMNA